ncbi:DUF5643 domain-containing protein [Intestinibacter bartlettii]|uniref:DUF4179 domain-containing protein n=1 Tax=Intestinibacter bartlettii TaxID=261299 RepID=A0ABS6DWW2_9FIRM|nr:DUF5643 domain-containing protein [Intestinibacter bartlettii]MBU5336336.1 hypothetical protein [Intestinibacter bartlettii]MDO5009287.1 hypothetical protein [Intestinibacter bartlettii]
MDKNKDKRNFLDEDEEIEKLLSEYENEDIKIPDELDERLNAKLKELKPKKYKKWAITSVASILIIGVSYAFVPSFRTFADTMFKYIFGDIGIENAVNNGYKSSDSQHINIGGYDITIQNIYIDEQRISFEAIMETKIGDMVADDTDEGNYYELYVDSIEASMSGGIFYKDEDGIIKTTVNVVGSDVENILEGKGTLELKLKLIKEPTTYNQEDENWERETLGTTKVKLDIPKQLNKTKNIEINKQINDGDLNLNIDKLKVSPTMMYLNTSGEVRSIGKLQGLDNLRIISENGEIYRSSLELSGIGLENGGWSQTIVPSVYYDKGKKLKLKADGALVNANKKIELSLNDNYPKKIDYFGRTVTIKNVEYNSGKLIVKYTTDSSIAYNGGCKLDGNYAISLYYESGSNISGMEFDNVEKKESYILDLGLVLKYKYPIELEINNR